jgi:serine/threonine-protein kinase
MQNQGVRGGHSFGKYRLLAELGSGGMGVIYLAVAAGPAGFTKLVVLKALHPSMTEDPSFLGMFLDEARLAARLNHPNVVQTYEVGEEFGRPVITMEYLEGQTLAQVLSRERRAHGRPNAAVFVRVVIEALAGLHYAHELRDFNGTPLNIVHRDASPHNVFLTYDGQVKVLDFGIAKAATSSVQTSTGMLKGKPRYMSPEQLAGAPVDRRADLFSVGVVLWEVLAGERILKDVSEIEAMGRLMQSKVPPPSQVNPAVHPALEAVCMRALAPDREARFPTALAMQEELERALAQAGEAVTVREVGARVAELFAAERERRRAVVEECLARPADATQSMLPTLGTHGGLSGVSPSLSGAGWNTPTRDATRERSPAARAAYLAPIGAAALAAAVGFGLWLRPAVERGGAPAAPLVVASAAPSAAPAAEAAAEREALVAVTLAAQPEGAKLFLDDAQLATNPFRGAMRKDGSPHHVRAEARGYVSKTVAIVIDRAQDVAIVLERQAPPAAPAHPARGPAVAAPRPAPERQASAPPPAAPAAAPPARTSRPLDASNPWDD